MIIMGLVRVSTVGMQQANLHRARENGGGAKWKPVRNQSETILNHFETTLKPGVQSRWYPPGCCAGLHKTVAAGFASGIFFVSFRVQTLLTCSCAFRLRKLAQSETSGTKHILHKRTYFAQTSCQKTLL